MKYVVEEYDVYPRADDESERSFEVDDDAIVLTAEHRGSKRLVVAVAEPDTTEQCQYVKEADGEQCSRDAEDGSDYCWQHGGDD